MDINKNILEWEAINDLIARSEKIIDRNNNDIEILKEDIRLMETQNSNIKAQISSERRKRAEVEIGWLTSQRT